MNNYPNFHGKVALVTGASSGMGLATAQAFAEAGASVALANFREEAVRKAAEKLVSDGHRAVAIHCDVSNDAQVEAMVERTVAEFGRLDAAFNNAGIMAKIAPVALAAHRNAPGRKRPRRTIACVTSGQHDPKSTFHETPHHLPRALLRGRAHRRRSP